MDSEDRACEPDTALPSSPTRDPSAAAAAQPSGDERSLSQSLLPANTTTTATAAATTTAARPTATKMPSRHDKRVSGFPPVPLSSWLPLCSVSRLCGQGTGEHLSTCPCRSATPHGGSCSSCGCCAVGADSAGAACLGVDGVVAADSPRGLFLARGFCPDHASVHDALGSAEADGLKWTGLKLDNKSTKTCVHSSSCSISPVGLVVRAGMFCDPARVCASWLADTCPPTWASGTHTCNLHAC